MHFSLLLIQNVEILIKMNPYVHVFQTSYICVPFNSYIHCALSPIPLKLLCQNTFCVQLRTTHKINSTEHIIFGMTHFVLL